MEMCIKHYAEGQQSTTAKQLYVAEDLLHQIRLHLIETETIALAEWTDRLYLTAKRVERDRVLRKSTANADHWLKIADWTSKILIKARKNNGKIGTLGNTEIQGNFSAKLNVAEKIGTRENRDH